jgi:hypothetical protein
MFEMAIKEDKMFINIVADITFLPDYFGRRFLTEFLSGKTL